MLIEKHVSMLSDPAIAKARRKVLPALSQSCTFNIPDQFALTTDRKRFLLIDESPVRRERLLVFASDRQLDVLFEAETIYMDGTFSKTPPHFTQIYIIRAVNYDICKEIKSCSLKHSAFFLPRSSMCIGVYGQQKEYNLEGNIFRAETNRKRTSETVFSQGDHQRL